MAKGHKDKIAIVTGAAEGIGAAFAKRLAEDGVHVAVVDLAQGEETVHSVAATGRNTVAVRCDVSDPDAVAAMAETVRRQLGEPQIVVNCAGIYPRCNFLELSFAEWRKVLAINLDGTFLVTSAFAPGMKRMNWGRVVNIASSTLGLVTRGFAHYMASKAGIVGFTRAIATDLAPFGITANVISPGLTRSTGTLARTPQAHFKSLEDEFAAAARMQAIQRVEVPEDLVGAVSFLTSDDAAFITGQTIVVDGGLVRV